MKHERDVLGQVIRVPCLRATQPQNGNFATTKPTVYVKLPTPYLKTYMEATKGEYKSSFHVS